jgi:hypothetical protein
MSYSTYCQIQFSHLRAETHFCVQARRKRTHNKRNNAASFKTDYCGSTLPRTEFSFYEFPPKNRRASTPALRCYAKRYVSLFCGSESITFIRGIQMIRFINLSLLILSLLCLSCKKEDSPVSPTPSPKIMLLSEYGSLIDSAFYKMWSDSSWERFNQVVTLNGITYVTVISNDGNEYYYSALGYAGVKPQGQSLIIFDRPLPSLPDTVVFGQTYTRETSFFYQGYNYSLKYEQYLQDTVSISVPFGTFNPCLWFKSMSTLSAGGQSQTQNGEFWLARGPSDIKQTLNSGLTIVMVRGRVNGQGWGMPFAKQSPDNIFKESHRFVADIVKPLFQMWIPK